MKFLSRCLFLAAFVSFGFATNAQSNLKNYLGEYSVAEGPLSTIKIYMDGDKLMGEAVGQGTSELSASDQADVFNVVDYDGELTFLRNEMKIVTGLELSINGTDISASREIPDLEEYNGTFIFSDGPVSELIFEAEDGQLMAEAGETGRGPVDATSNIDEFYGATYQSEIVFSRNDDNLIDSVFISVQGMVLEGAKEMDAPAEEMESPYVGVYELEPGSPISEVLVEEKDGVLYGSSEQGEAELKPTDNADIFEIIGYDGEVEFFKDDMGKVSSMVMRIQGQEMKATKAN